MPQSQNVHAQEMHNIPEQAHTKAATSHDQSDHLTAHELSKENQQKTQQAHEHAEKLIKQAEQK